MDREYFDYVQTDTNVYLYGRIVRNDVERSFEQKLDTDQQKELANFLNDEYEKRKKFLRSFVD